MYRHFIIRKLKDYAKFSQLKNARYTELKLLTVAVARADGEKAKELERMYYKKQAYYTLCERQRVKMERHLLQLEPEEREIITDFYIERRHDRYSAYYKKYNCDYELIKNNALDRLADIYLKDKRKKALNK